VVSPIFLVFLRLKKRASTTEKSPSPATPLDSCRTMDDGKVVRRAFPERGVTSRRVGIARRRKLG
jgi:hypothetical protein